jgi:hypothetical protein
MLLAAAISAQGTIDNRNRGSHSDLPSIYLQRIILQQCLIGTYK